jgi:predicted nucleic acid-binding protein
MAFYYFDASALVKYYVTEPGSMWVRWLIEERETATETGYLFRRILGRA